MESEITMSSYNFPADLLLKDTNLALTVPPPITLIHISKNHIHSLFPLPKSFNPLAPPKEMYQNF